MIASALKAPLLLKEAMDREIESIHNEYKMCYPDDNVRLLQVLAYNTGHDDHIFNRFAWGNTESLRGENEESLWDDLKEFYETNYSADRTRVVIQVKTSDKLQELRSWVEKSLGEVPNRNLGV